MEAFLTFVKEQKVLLIVIGVAIVLLILVSIFGKVKAKKDEQKEVKEGDQEHANEADNAAEPAVEATVESVESEETIVEEKAEAPVVQEAEVTESAAEEVVVEAPVEQAAPAEDEKPAKKTRKKKEVKAQPVAEEVIEAPEEEVVEETKLEEASAATVEDTAEEVAAEATDKAGLPGTVEIYKGKNDFYFSFRASNNILIGRSQGYTTKDACKRGVHAVMTAAEVADIRDSVKVEDEKTYKPAFGKSVFEVYMDKEGKYRWRLYAKNQQNILASKGYTSKAGAKRAVQSLKKIAANYVLEDLTKATK